MIYLHIYPSTYNLYVKMTSPKKILVHIQDPNSELNWLWYFDDFYFTYVILGMIICVCPNVHHMIISEMLFYDMYIIRYNKLWSLWYWTEILLFYTLHVLLHVIIFAIYIQRMNDSRYNTHFNIWYDEKFPIMLDSVTFLNMYKISSYLQSLFARVN